MTGPNFNKNSGVGKLATNRYDFEDHVNGVNRQHSDNDILLSEPLVGITAGYVSEALAALNDNILNFDFFVTVGADTDVWSTGVFDDSVANLDIELTDVLTNVSNPKYDRIKNGGIIVIKSGTHKIGKTVEIPAGIILMGEGFGTKLVNTTVLDPTSPRVAAELPMFLVKGDIDRSEDKAVVSSVTTYDPFLTSKGVKMINLIISDNYLKPAFLGDTAYRTVQNLASPLVSLERGGGLECEGVVFFGRSGSGTPTQTTYSAISIDYSSGSNYSTNLDVKGCQFDGFNRTIDYSVLKGTLDYFSFKNNRVRNFGPVGGTVDAENSNVIFANGCNIDISSNYILTDTDLLALVYIDAFTSDTTTVQGKSKIVISNNVLASDKPDNSAYTPVIIDFNAGIAGAISSKCVLMTVGNTFDDAYGYKISVTPGVSLFEVSESVTALGVATAAATVLASTLTMTATGAVAITADTAAVTAAAGLTATVTGNTSVTSTGTTSITSTGATSITSTGAATLAGSDLTLTGSQTVSTVAVSGDLVITTQFILFVDTSALAISITLPAHSAGRMVIIKDSGGNSSVNNITLVRNGATGNIDDYAGDRTISVDWASWTLVSNGSNWLLI